MKNFMRMRKHPDTHPGDDLYCIRLDVTRMTEREFLAAMREFNSALGKVMQVALLPVDRPSTKGGAR